jgi:hypothetical protein
MNKTHAETLASKGTRHSQARSFHSRNVSEKVDDIFSVNGNKRILSNQVAENNKLATDLITKRRKYCSEPIYLFILLVYNGDTYSNSVNDNDWSSSRRGAQILIKRRQDDYWNKIALYNCKISELEEREAKEKKKNDQLRMRSQLNEQVLNKNKSTSNQMESDRLYMASLTEKALQEETQEKQKRADMKRKLQKIN